MSTGISACGTDLAVVIPKHTTRKMTTYVQRGRNLATCVHEQAHVAQNYLLEFQILITLDKVICIGDDEFNFLVLKVDISRALALVHFSTHRQ
jgi:hypothetical protein